MLKLQIKPELIAATHCAVGESTLWHAAENALYWVDITAGKIHRWAASTGALAEWQADEMIGCIAIHHAGGLIAGMASGVFHLNLLDDGMVRAEKLASVPHSAPNMRFNDGRCDRQGRLLAGTMTVDQQVGVGNPSVYQFSQGTLKTLLAGNAAPFVTAMRPAPPLVTPNGTAFSPDGRQFYLSDSNAVNQVVWRFAYDADTGTPHTPQLFIDFNQHQGRPDGAAMDTDGCYWICATDVGMVHRFTPQGKLDYSLRLPVKKPTLCAFGGADLSTLYVASIRPSGDVSDQPLAGGVFAFEGLGVQGMAESVFAG
jgi:sugar lactone lactonase YvrE